MHRGKQIRLTTVLKQPFEKWNNTVQYQCYTEWDKTSVNILHHFDNLWVYTSGI